MAAEVVMPKFGLTMVEGTIQRWFKNEGEAINEGEALFEVETEKVLYEVESTASGVVAKLLYGLEAVVPVGLPVAVIAEAGEDMVEVAAGYSDGTPAAPATTSPAASPPRSSGSAVSATADGERTPVTPAARKLATQHHIDPASLTGTGPGGRITREDVQQAVDSPTPATPPTLTPAAPAPAASQSVPLRGMRKVIAERMHKSLQNTAQLTLTTEVDVTQLIERREQVRRAFNTTYNDFIIQACAHALLQHPRMNASLEGDAIQLHRAVHVGFAVALDEGLIVPVIHDANKKPLKIIAEEARALAEKARAGTLKLEEVSRGTFTVSNLGMAGVDAFTPILNSPQTGILGVGRIGDKPVVYQGEIAKRSMLVLSLTFDHRVIDGAPAGAFLGSVAELLSHGNRITLAVD